MDKEQRLAERAQELRSKKRFTRRRLLKPADKTRELGRRPDGRDEALNA